MRTNIVHQGAGELSYEIRGIVDFARELERAGRPIVWENIGDPVAKGEKLPEWMKGIVQETLKDDAAFAYSPTKGLLETREFLAGLRKKEGVALDADHILFFNGLGDAISKVYTYLNRHARVIGPSPAYPTHSSAEAAHAGSHHLTYELNHERNWLPDLEDLRNKVRYNESIAGILVINPDNPTGMVYPEEVLRGIVNIAREFDLFLVSDEIYSGLAYGPEKFVPLAKLLDGVPAIVMRGLSKEIPWPGARSGWIEVYNQERDESFARYVKTIHDAKMLEVCSTTLPQKVLPKILGDGRYPEYLAARRAAYARRADEAVRSLGRVRGVRAIRPSGAFYLTVVFEDGALRPGQSLSIDNAAVRALVEKKVAALAESELDKRFVYHLLGATGICVVPLSGFNTALPGFRMTLLEQDDERFSGTLEALARAIGAYLS